MAPAFRCLRLHVFVSVAVLMSRSANLFSQARVVHHSITSNPQSILEIPKKTEWELVQLTLLTQSTNSTSSEYHIIQIEGNEAFNVMQFHLVKKRTTYTDFTMVVKDGDNESEEIIDEENVSECFYTAFSSFDSEIQATFSTCGHSFGFSGVILNSSGHWRIEPHPDLDKDRMLQLQSQNTSTAMHIIFKINGTENWPAVTSNGDSSNKLPNDFRQTRSTDEISEEHVDGVLNQGLLNSFDPKSSSNEMTNDQFNLLNSKTGKGKKKPKAGNGKKKANTGKTASTGSRVVEIAVFVDPPLWTRLQAAYPSDTVAKSREYVLTLINTMDLLFKQPSLGIPLKFRLVHLEIQKAWPSKLKHHKGSVDQYLDGFCDYAGDLNKNNERWDHGLMLTGYDLHDMGENSVAGVAYGETMCNRYYSCSLSEATDFTAVYVIAHELGHSVGMEHDGVGVSKKCSRAKFIMAAYTGAGQVTWSICSRENLAAFLEFGNAAGKKKGKKPSCLSKLSSGQTAIPFSAEKLPGHIYDANIQCSMHMGPGSKALLSTKEPANNICNMLYCINKEKSTSAYPSHPALEGTPCSTTTIMQCRRGQCVE